MLMNSGWPPSCVAYTLFFFLYLSIWPDSLVLLRVVLGYIGLRINFCSYKLTQRLIFYVFIHPNSHVNRTVKEIAFLGVRFLQRLDYAN